MHLKLAFLFFHFHSIRNANVGGKAFNNTAVYMNGPVRPSVSESSKPRNKVLYRKSSIKLKTFHLVFGMFCICTCITSNIVFKYRPFTQKWSFES